MEPQLRVVEEAEGHGRAEEDCSTGLTSIIVTVLALPKRNIGNGHESPLLVIVIFVTVINRPLRLFVFSVTNVKRPLRIMALLVTIVFKNRYRLDASNGRTKRPLPLLLISNRRCGGVAGLGLARIIGNARCSAPVTDVLLCNELLTPVTKAVLLI